MSLFARLLKPAEPLMGDGECPKLDPALGRAVRAGADALRSDLRLTWRGRGEDRVCPVALNSTLVLSTVTAIAEGDVPVRRSW
jgi:hypothetical protein